MTSTIEDRAREAAERLYQDYHEEHRGSDKEREFFAERITTFAKAELVEAMEAAVMEIEQCTTLEHSDWGDGYDSGLTRAAEIIRALMEGNKP